MTDWTLTAANWATFYNVPIDLVEAVVWHESSGDPLAVGDGGIALGLMQVHPSAAATVRESWQSLKAAIESGNTEAATDLGLKAGIKYLAFCYKQMGDWDWALAAYNQGPTVIGRAMRYVKAVNAIRSQHEQKEHT